MGLYKSQAADVSVQQIISLQIERTKQLLWYLNNLLANLSLFAGYVLVFQKLCKEHFL